MGRNLIEECKQLSNKHNAFNAGACRHVLSCCGRQGNCALQCATESYWSTVEHEDKARCRLPSDSITSPVRVSPSNEGSVGRVAKMMMQCALKIAKDILCCVNMCVGGCNEMTSEETNSMDNVGTRGFGGVKKTAEREDV